MSLARGRPGRIANTRELVIPELPYLVGYRVKEEVIVLASSPRSNA